MSSNGWDVVKVGEEPKPDSGWDVVGTGDEPKKQDDSFHLMDIVKAPTKLIGEGAGFVGGLAPMAATYMSYAANRMLGADHEQATASALKDRERVDPSAGIEGIADTLGIDKSWVQSSAFRDFMKEFHEKWIQPASDTYFPAQNSLAKTMFEDVANVATFGTLGKGYAKGKEMFADSEVRKAQIKARSDQIDRTIAAKDEPENPLPTIDPEWQVVKTIDESQAGAAHEIDSQQPLTPIRDDTPAFTAEAEPEKFKRGYPTISKEFKVPPTEAERIANDQSIPVAGLPEIENGFGPDMIQEDLPLVGSRRGIMPGALPAEANFDGLQGTHEMTFRPDIDPSLGVSPDGMSIRGNINGAMALSSARSIGDAVNVVKTYGTEAEKSLAKIILDSGVDHDIPFELDRTLENRGQIHTSKDTGDRVVSINPSRADAETILHEATHAHTNDALNASEVGLANPAQLKYSNEVRTLYSRTKEYLADHPEIPVLSEWLRNIKEFNAYGLTSPIFQGILHSIPFVKGGTVKTGFMDAVKKLFGVKDKETQSVFEKLIDLTSQWKDINSPETRASAVEKVYRSALDRELKSAGLDPQKFDTKDYETWSRMTGDFIGRPGDILHIGSRPFRLRGIDVVDGDVVVEGDVYADGQWHPQKISAWYVDEVRTLTKGPITVDSLAEMAAKRIDQQLKDWRWDPKVDYTRADKGWTNIFTDGLGLRGPGKGQGGFIDMKPVFDFVKGVLGFSPKVLQDFKARLATHYAQFRDAKEVRQWLESNDIKDLMGTTRFEWAGMLDMQNQLAQRMADNPVISFVFNNLQIAARQAEKRMYGYHLEVKDGKAWATANPTEAVRFLREWEQLNALPQLRQLAEQLDNNPAARQAYWQSKGIDPKAVEKLEPYVEVMKDVLRADNQSLAAMGRTIAKPQGTYFPLGRHGPYHVTVWDDNGEVRMAYAFDNLAEARIFADAFAKKAPAGWKSSDVVRTDPTRIINTAMMEALLSNAPDWLHNIAVTSMGKQMAYQRNFEKGRSAHYTVDGYIGQLAPKTTKEYRAQLENYMNAIQQRLRESYHLEQASEAMKIGNELLTDPSVLLDKYPNTYRWANNMVARQIGVDLGGSKDGGPFQEALIQMGKVLTKMDGLYEGYKPKPGDNVVGPSSFKSGVKMLNFFASLGKIGLNPNVLAGNLVQNATIMMDGVRMAGRLGMSPLHAMAAQAHQLAYMAAAPFGGLAIHKGVRDFMIAAKAEGVIDPHGREDFSITDSRERTRNLGILDKLVQGPRDAIERFTNYNAVLYYKLMVDSMRKTDKDFQSLSDAEAKQVVYNMAHSFTGDYSPTANMFAFEKAGAKGAILSNFAKWKFNRIGRYLDDTSMALNAAKYGPSAVVPLAMTVAMGLVMAGVQGTVGLVEYEAIRQWLQKLGLADLKPMSAIISDNYPSIRDTWMNRGMVTYLSDQTAQQFGEKSGPDISGSLRDSSALEITTVLPGTLVDVIKGAGTVAKAVLSRPSNQKWVESMLPENMTTKGSVYRHMVDQHWTGITHQDTENAVAALPSAFQEPMRQFLDVHMTRGENSVTQARNRQVGNYVRDPFQESLANGLYVMGGLKTTDEKKHDDAVNYFRYMQKLDKDNENALKDTLINSFRTKDQEMANYAFAHLIQNQGPEKAKAAMREAVNSYVLTSRTEFFEHQGIKAGTASSDPFTQIQILQMMQKAEKVWHDKNTVDGLKQKSP